MPRPEPVLTAQEFANQIIAIARGFSETQAKQRSVANDLDTRLIQIGRQSREWKTAEQGIPALIFQAQAEGYEPSRTAVLLGVSPSYVRRILRENHHYSWRVDLFESDAGPGGQPWEEGEDVIQGAPTTTCPLSSPNASSPRADTDPASIGPAC
ncbi:MULTISPECIES: hypothetical protein [Streptomyces]|uniref:hypothetical protein n=1 Tax=Streptomyces TaxID=1883 RepID=UPI0005163CC5|nr:MULTISPECIES: hypothetical protein [Streptomyces]WSU72656.1 hypothetical protein OG499_06745 [Streptomyces anulatus]WTD28954.1 hypothetical protein OH737_32520 [Streptomyces anulatus]